MTIDVSKYRTPGQLIQELLDARGWTQRVLSIILKTDETVVNKIISGKRSLDAETALILSEMFEVSAEDFLTLQKSYELAQARIVVTPDPERMNRAHLFGSLPISEMIKRGWIDAENIRDVSKVESELARFFGVASVDEIETLPHAAKKTNVSDEVTPVQLAWIYRVRQIAKDTYTPKYSEEAARAAIPKLKELLISADAIRKVPRILTECGIRYVLVESLSGAKIDGVCFWLDAQSPVIGMTLRYDRIDNFWFVLRHELEHVLRGHGQSSIIVDAELEGERAGVGSDVTEEERVANEAAAEFCVSQRSLSAFVARKSPFFAERDIIGFSRTLNVHPGIVAGQLQRKIKRYDRFRNHLVKIRSIIAPNALVDGWGDVAPVDI